jgi:hypothetical protein
MNVDKDQEFPFSPPPPSRLFACAFPDLPETHTHLTDVYHLLNLTIRWLSTNRSVHKECLHMCVRKMMMNFNAILQSVGSQG